MEPLRPLTRLRARRTAARDPSRLAVIAAGVAAAVICIVAGTVAWWNVTAIVDEVTARDVDAADAMATSLDHLPPERRIAALPEPNSRTVFALVTPDGDVNPADLGVDAADARWDRWVSRVVRDAEVNRTFESRDPSGTGWQYVTSPLRDGSILVLGRPDGPQPPVQSAALRTLGVVLGAAVVLGLLAWPLVRRGFLRPLDSLIVATEDLRWRGQVRKDDRPWVDHLTRRGDHVGRLARSLTAVEQDITWRFLQLSTLLETIRAVGASLDTAEVFDRILGQLQRLFGVDRCAVLSLDERANQFMIRASLGLSDDFVRSIRVDVTEPNSPSMRALRTGEPVQVSDTEADLSFASFRARSRRFDYRSVLAIPMTTSMAAPSTLLLYRSEPYRYSHSELELAMSFARFASIAMENAALYRRIDDRLQEQTRRLEAIVESLDDGLVLAERDGQVSYHNAAAVELLGTPGEELAGSAVRDLIRRVGASLTTPESTATVDGRELRLRSFEVNDEHGTALGQGYLWQDVTEDRVIERLKASLLTTASHELRTPLANIKGYVTTLLADDIEWDVTEQRQFLATISTETDRLTTLVGNLLDMSRIEAGALVIRPAAVAVQDLIDRAVAGFPPEARRRLRFHVDDGARSIDVDRARIETAVRNLVDNALKFAAPPTVVDIVVRWTDADVQIAIRDRGVGVPDDLRDRVFDSFVRGDEGLARKAGGFGLGLAICHGFVAAHGGRVWFQPESPGTTFTLAIPIQQGVRE
jgi:PAS domain S-box-containing protein